MDENDAEEFFEALETPLKETFRIPKKKETTSSEEGGGEIGKDSSQSPLLKSKNGTSETKKSGYEDTRKRPSLFKTMYPKKARKKKVPDAPIFNEYTSGTVVEYKYFAQKNVQDFYQGPLPDEVFENCTATHCGLCDLSMTSESFALIHYSGKPHLKVVDCTLNKLYLDSSKDPRSIPRRLSKTKVLHMELKNEDFIRRCEICRVDLSSTIVSTSHFNGARHLKALKRQGEYPAKQEESPKEFSSSSSPYTCKVCKVDLKSEVTLKDHLLGKPHLNRVKLLSDEPSSPFFCKVCSVNTSDEKALEIHCKGKKHLKKLALAK
eukprot:TRINITY_DN6402_c0_g1_i1.p1 TRINITY_DN6402_c0_g1~~TRINITY_DN6402_c0_g1_i1.p1  ORF type:complete len:321 (+),score=92.82 TRINITY_DN6402_c0_g1_i1:32-994(+)